MRPGGLVVSPQGCASRFRPTASPPPRAPRRARRRAAQPAVDAGEPARQGGLPDYDVDDELERTCIPQFEARARGGPWG
jgi:hypothetical protein